MNITTEHIDELNAIVKVDINKDDYSDKVEKILKDYRKTANIPGFRKGHVPIGLVKKQYGKAVLIDEVNKLLQDALGNYLTEEKLDVLGNPLPKPQDELDWDADSFSFEFELGLAPEFEVQLKGKDPILHYQVIADDKMIDSEIEHIQKQYSTLISQDQVTETSEITGKFFNSEENIDTVSTISFDKLNPETAAKIILGAKVNDVLAFNTKSLFQNESDLIIALKITTDQAENLDINLEFEISEINQRELADLDQDLFDKLFGKDTVKTVTELRAKIKEESEKNFEKQSDQKLLDDVTNYLFENTTFDLPSEFLQKWLQATDKKSLTEDQAKEEYETAEKAIRYQLIEGKIISEYKLQLEFDDIKSYTTTMIKEQMVKLGQLNPSEKELENITARILSSQDEVKRVSDQLMSEKLLELYKAEAHLKIEKLTYEDFIKTVYN